MKWGLKEQESLSYKPSTDNITKAQLLAEYLFLVIIMRRNTIIVLIIKRKFYNN